MARLNCVALCVLGCALHDADAQQVRDSAGVRIVSYAPNDAPKQRWSLEPKPLLEIGGSTDEGPTAFAEIRGVVLLSDGRVAVANQQPSEIRLFTASGQFIRALGRNGQGPGEFNRVLWRLLRSGDTLIGVDNSMRAQVFDPSGELRRSLPRPRPPAAQGNPARLAFSADGSAIVQAVESAGQTTATDAPVFLRLSSESPDGEQYLDLLRVLAYRPIAARGPTPPMVVFGPRSAVAVNLTRICVGYTSTFTLTCYDHAGKAVVVVRRHVTPRAITDADRQFFRDAYLAANKGAPPKVIAAIQESNRLTQFANRAPAFSRVVFAVSGELWVSEFDRTETALGPPTFRTTQVPLRWSVFGVDGAWLSDVVLPARFTPHEMGFDYVIGTSFGTDDVERVTMYRIRR